MSKHVLKELPELISKGVITIDVAERIKLHYLAAESKSNKLVLVFGILGALLTGLGIILIIAHNWDELSKTLKLFLAFLPLLTGQALCAYALLKKPSWKEVSSVFVFFSVAASISIVSQVYNIHGDLAGFILIWMILSIPLMYIMKARMVSLLVIWCITWYAVEKISFHSSSGIPWNYWVMISSVIPFSFMITKMSGKNFMYFHIWLLASSLLIGLASFSGRNSSYLYIGYTSLFSAYILLGSRSLFSSGKLINNAFLVLGSLGCISVLLLCTFEWMWSMVANDHLVVGKEFYASIVISAFTFVLLLQTIRKHGAFGINPLGFVFLLFIILFFLGMSQPILTQIATNVLVLVIAVLTTKRGADQDNLFILNYGILIMTALIICRFFDTELSFVLRGILFITVGFSFFGANYWMMKKRKG
jgi:uncharacterized membrane protein